jgi:4-hydroxy-L-threonine phosphate dehydrogenase PdxA
LKRVSGMITKKSVSETINLTHRALKGFGIRSPRIGVSALNPHAGDSGVLGTEDQRIITPVVRAWRQKGISIWGPISADVLWTRADQFDALIAMYHDQGQIPFKLLAFKSKGKDFLPGGVNMTLGLPFVRTSVSHGTAYDIAGKGKISPRSFFEALNLAARMAKKSQYD